MTRMLFDELRQYVLLFAPVIAGHLQAAKDQKNKF